MTSKFSKVTTPKYAPDEDSPSNQHLDLALNHASDLIPNPSLPRSSRTSGASFRESLSQVNSRFIFFLAIATLGPLQYGYHIVTIPFIRILSQLTSPSNIFSPS